MIDAASTAQLGEVSFLRWAALLWVLNFMFFNIGTWWAKAYIHRRYQPLIKNRIIAEMFAYTARAHSDFFHQRSSGRLEKETITLANTIERMLEFYMPELIHTFTMPLISLATMWSIDIRFAILLIAWLVVLFVASYMRSKKLLALSDAHSVCESQTSGQLVDVYANIHSVRLFDNSPYEVNRLHRFLDNAKAAYQQMKTQFISLHTLQGGMLVLMLAGMMYYLT